MYFLLQTLVKYVQATTKKCTPSAPHIDRHLSVPTIKSLKTKYRLEICSHIYQLIIGPHIKNS